MATWKIIVNSFLILVILAASIAVIADYRSFTRNVQLFKRIKE